MALIASAGFCVREASRREACQPGPVVVSCLGASTEQIEMLMRECDPSPSRTWLGIDESVRIPASLGSCLVNPFSHARLEQCLGQPPPDERPAV